MNTTNVNIPEATEKAIVEFKDNTSLRAIKLIINDETLEVSTTVEATGTIEQDFNSLIDYVEKEEPAFFIVHLERCVEHPEYTFLVYIPQACPIRPRTIFASSRVPVERYISRIFSSMGNYFFDDVKDLTYKSFCAQNRKDDSALTFEEKLERQEQTEIAVQQTVLPTHDSFTWPCTDELMDALKLMKDGEGPSIIAGKGNDAGDAVELGGSGDSIADLKCKSPRYVAARVDGKLYFILYCPDTARPREKMMSSTCKASFLKGCAEAGIEFEKNFDIRDEDEFTDEYLDELVHPKDVDHGYGQVKIVRKPKRPGRR